MSEWHVPFFGLLSESSVLIKCQWKRLCERSGRESENLKKGEWKKHKLKDKHRQTDKQKTRQCVGHSHAKRPSYLWTLAQAQNQRQCHWGGRTEGGLRSVFGSSSSSGLGVVRGLQGGERHRHGITGPEAQVHFLSPTTKILCLLSEVV